MWSTRTAYSHKGPVWLGLISQGETDFTCHHSHRSNEAAAKVESGMGYPDWHTAMHSLRLQRIYCNGHAGVRGNEQIGRLARAPDITSGLQRGRTEVLRGLRNSLSIDRPKGKMSGEKISTLWRSVFNQTNISTISMATLEKLLRDEAERVWAFQTLRCHFEWKRKQRKGVSEKHMGRLGRGREGSGRGGGGGGRRSIPSPELFAYMLI